MSFGFANPTQQPTPLAPEYVVYNPGLDKGYYVGSVRDPETGVYSAAWLPNPSTPAPPVPNLLLQSTGNAGDSQWLPIQSINIYDQTIGTANIVGDGTTTTNIVTSTGSVAAWQPKGAIPSYPADTGTTSGPATGSYSYTATPGPPFVSSAIAQAIAQVTLTPSATQPTTKWLIWGVATFSFANWSNPNTGPSCCALAIMPGSGAGGATPPSGLLSPGGGLPYTNGFNPQYTGGVLASQGYADFPSTVSLASIPDGNTGGAQVSHASVNDNQLGELTLSIPPFVVSAVTSNFTWYLQGFMWPGNHTWANSGSNPGCTMKGTIGAVRI